MAQCMRAHGASNFPDPISNNGAEGFSVSATPGSPTLTVNNITFSGPAFEAAIQKCKFFGGGSRPAPISGTQKEGMIAKARCIRRHGVPNFPDPTIAPNGEGVGINLGPSFNPNAPAVRNALKECANVGQSIPGV